MRGKRAKMLRKMSKVFDVDVAYDSTEALKPPVWAPMPTVKDKPWKVDQERLDKALANAPNPKFKTFGARTFIRLAKGSTVRLDAHCNRALYQALKYGGVA